MDDSDFWEKKKAASYATLMRVEHVHRIEEFDIAKTDPRGWVVVRPAPSERQGELPLISQPIIAFSGSSQTGKTTVARRLADKLRWKFLSFGDFVRLQAMKRGLAEPTREELQDIGQKMVEENVVGFCREALSSVSFLAGEPLVIDGIRHTETLEAIRIMAAGQPVKLVHLYAPMETREARSRDTAPNNLQRRDSHRVESQTNVEVRSTADLVIDTSADLNLVFDRILQWVLNDCQTARPK